MGLFEIVQGARLRAARYWESEVKRLEREAVARKAEHALHVESLDREHRIDITEYEADLGAARSREEIATARVRELEQHVLELGRIAKGGEWLAKAELEKANRSWLAAQRNLDDAVARGDEVRNELATLRRQVSQAREAHEKLYAALYPDLIDKRLRIDPDAKEKGERLREAGYGCATQKKLQKSGDSYVG